MAEKQVPIRIGLVADLLRYEAASKILSCFCANPEVQQSHNIEVSMRIIDIDQLRKSGKPSEVDKAVDQAAFDLTVYNQCDYIVLTNGVLHRAAEMISQTHIIPDTSGTWPRIDSCTEIVLLHVGSSIVSTCSAKELKRIALLGSRDVMLEDFLKNYPCMDGLEVVDDIFEMSEIETIDKIVTCEFYRGRPKCGELQGKIRNIIHEADIRDFAKGRGGIDGFVFCEPELEIIMQKRDEYCYLADGLNHHYMFIGAFQELVKDVVAFLTF